ncbi:hypothetical protein E6C27_scaffold131G00390 [Cucumis melo var. makuwa]|uniref:Uncharacterized protein n=1 Tax=Cucumis melo var. makuwa TaxID=1194695 RepID=A0A5A7UK76_CUCMM|nr:hypothetical protein E6C27_scaffold131G00390 [Cucumis melo var. makuwa]
MHKNVGENKKYVGKRYVDVFHGVGTNVGRTESREAFPTSYLHGFGNASPDIVTCIGNSGIGNASSPTDLMLTQLPASRMPLPTFSSQRLLCVGTPFPDVSYAS